MKLTALWPWSSDDGGWDEDEEDPEPLRCLIAFMVLACLMLMGCAGAKVTPEQGPTILNWSSASISDSSARAWAVEAEKRLHTKNFVLLVVHGGTAIITDRDGHKHSEWRCYPDVPRKSMPVDDVAWVMRNIWWDKPIVMVSCNEGAFKLTCPNTLYSKRVVWCNPNSAFPLWQFRRQDWIGRIEDFTSTQPVKLAGER